MGWGLWPTLGNHVMGNLAGVGCGKSVNKGYYLVFFPWLQPELSHPLLRG